jgi:superoxide reductase
MAEFKKVYRCNVCGNIVVVLHEGKAPLICCGQPMELLKENSVDASLEKHVPVIEIGHEKIKIIVGEVPHPMEETHYIEWIMLDINDKMLISFLKPGMKPEAEFWETLLKDTKISARAYCNLHGLWKSN